MRKTYKLYIGGQFPRSESGRSYVVGAPDGTPLANAVRGSRKDVRDAVKAARGAFPGWSDRTAMNRGQVLYRVAELMEGRRDQFEAEVAEAEGLAPAQAREQVDRSIDRWVWYAGWADKIAQILGTVNPVAASYFDFTIPEPTGVVGVVAPESSSLLGLVSRLAPVVVSGNTAVVLASESRPLPAVTLAEVLATSDVPGGVINLITGYKTRAGALAGGAHGRQRARHLGRAARDARGRGGVGRRERQAPLTPAPRRGPGALRLARRRRAQRPGVDRGVPGDEDGLAPDRGMFFFTPLGRDARRVWPLIRSFTYQAFVPDTISDLELGFAASEVEAITHAERAIRVRWGSANIAGLESLSHQLLRAESVRRRGSRVWSCPSVAWRERSSMPRRRIERPVR